MIPLNQLAQLAKEANGKEWRNSVEWHNYIAAANPQMILRMHEVIEQMAEALYGAIEHNVVLVCDENYAYEDLMLEAIAAYEELKDE